jgi:hypothetical protein
MGDKENLMHLETLAKACQGATISAARTFSPALPR